MADDNACTQKRTALKSLIDISTDFLSEIEIDSYIHDYIIK